MKAAKVYCNLFGMGNLAAPYLFQPFKKLIWREVLSSNPWRICFCSVGCDNCQIIAGQINFKEGSDESVDHLFEPFSSYNQNQITTRSIIGEHSLCIEEYLEHTKKTASNLRSSNRDTKMNLKNFLSQHRKSFFERRRSSLERGDIKSKHNPNSTLYESRH